MNTIKREDIDRALAGDTSRLRIPFVGTRNSRGYKATNNCYFVDSSGWGRAGEPALTFNQFLRVLRPGFAYAITRAGQFQVYVQEYEKKCRLARSLHSG